MPSESAPEQPGPFQFAILILSFMLLAGIAAEWLLDLPAEVSRLIFLIDTAVCCVFLLDFAIRFRVAPRKLQFMKWGWIDLIASIPAIDALRWGRVLRIVRILRLLSTYHSLRDFLRALTVSKSSAGVAAVFVIAFLVVSFGSLGVLLAESRAEGGNIRTAEDAVWWSMTTITTVGYGDRFPVTDVGRLIASVLMVVGIGLFGTLSGAAAGFFLGGKPEEPEDVRQRREILAKIDALQQRLDERDAARPRSESEAHVLQRKPAEPQ
jgi:voltage-gated potassium channel